MPKRKRNKATNLIPGHNDIEQTHDESATEQIEESLRLFLEDLFLKLEKVEEIEEEALKSDENGRKRTRHE